MEMEHNTVWQVVEHEEPAPAAAGGGATTLVLRVSLSSGGGGMGTTPVVAGASQVGRRIVVHTTPDPSGTHVTLRLSVASPEEADQPLHTTDDKRRGAKRRQPERGEGDRGDGGDAHDKKKEKKKAEESARTKRHRTSAPAAESKRGEGQLTGPELPEETLVHIFSLVHPKEMWRSVSLVSKAWRELAQEESLWRGFYASYFGGRPPTLDQGESWQKATKAAFRSLIKDQAQYARQLAETEVKLREKTKSLLKSFHENRLRRVIENGQHVLVERFLNEAEAIGVSIKHFTRHGKHHHKETPLSVALSSRQLQVAEVLLRRGADPNEQMNTGVRPIHFVAEENLAEFVPLLVKYGAKLSGWSEDGFTAIQHAVVNDNLDVVRALLEAGADPKETSEDGETTIELAEANEEILELLKHHAKPKRHN